MLAESSGPTPTETADESAGLGRRRGSGLGKLAAAASLAICAATWAAYGTRADAVAAVTVCPSWAWALLGLGAGALAAVLRAGRGLVIVVVVAWLAYLVATADTPAALFRSAPAQPDNAGRIEPHGIKHVRVISLNCGLGNAQAARELKRFRPQIVLLQESPSQREIDDLAQELFNDQGGFLRGADATVVAHGEVTAIEGSDEAHSAMAHVRLHNGAELAVISLRLEPGIVRLDYWSPTCWRVQAENRRVRRRQLEKIMEPAADVPAWTPLLVGGDFNAPAGDAVFRLLQPRLRDAFVEAGVGWGNTITNDYPFARIDQIWVDRHSKAVAVQARRSAFSDHRMVIADLLVAAP